MALIDPTLLKKAAMISNAVITKFVLIGLGAWLGSKADTALNTTPLFLLIGIFAGGGAGLWYLFVIIKKNKIDDSDKIELSEGKKQKIMQEKIEEQKQEQEQKQVKNDIIRGYNPETDSWHCSECGVDMGSINPRQLCGKYYCKSDC